MKHDSIKRRREERLRQLREQMKSKTWEDSEIQSPESRNSYSSYTPSRKTSLDDEWDWEDDYDYPRKQEKSGNVGSAFLVKVIFSLFVLSSAYMIKHSNLPYFEQTQSMAKEVLATDYNFSGTLAMLQQYVGKTPEILPTMFVQKKGVIPAWNQHVQQPKYERPVEGKVVSPFVMDNRGIQIEAKPESEVKAMDQGWVIFVGQKEGLGQTVIIQHGNHTQSWYANVDQVQVNEQDWVQAGQLIGHVKKGKTLYFSISKDDHYIDPTSVISFD